MRLQGEFRVRCDVRADPRRDDICVFGGGGGVILEDEIRELEEYGVTRIYSSREGQILGLQGMVDDILERTRSNLVSDHSCDISSICNGDRIELARLISSIENQQVDSSFLKQIEDTVSRDQKTRAPVVGITGTGGAGKSSLTDELVLRWRLKCEDRLNIAILAIDPSRRKTGGALLGDRIRLNAIDSPSIYMRSLATRSTELHLPEQLLYIIKAIQIAKFDLLIIETPGIG